jgi:TrmH family RNA methyltransferase
MDVITSLQNPRVKAAAKLREGHARREQERFVIDGARELLRAMAAGIELLEAFVCRELCTTGESRQALVELDALPGGRVVEVSPAVFGKLAFGERAEGVLGVAMARTPTLADLKLPDNPLVAVVEGVEKPGNLGAVLRSADGAGVSAVIMADSVTDLYNPNTIRGSLGTVFSMPMAVASSQQTLNWLRGRNIRIFAAWVEGAMDYTSCDYRGPSALVLGSEAKGLSDVWQASDVTRIRLPMLGIADSLNVSTAAAVLFYEALRQRRAAPA